MPERAAHSHLPSSLAYSNLWCAECSSGRGLRVYVKWKNHMHPVLKLNDSGVDFASECIDAVGAYQIPSRFVALSIMRAGDVYCPNHHHTHALVVGTDDAAFHCDVCANTQSAGSVLYGCRHCDWDICVECLRTTNADDRECAERATGGNEH